MSAQQKHKQESVQVVRSISKLAGILAGTTVGIGKKVPGIKAFVEVKALAAADVVADEKEAIRMAMGFEKETILFFYTLRDLVTGGQQEMIGKIIAEEKLHLRRLAGML